jgi:hypothetical protein
MLVEFLRAISPLSKIHVGIVHLTVYRFKIVNQAAGLIALRTPQKAAFLAPLRVLGTIKRFINKK